jgi:hypothetical protein
LIVVGMLTALGVSGVNAWSQNTEPAMTPAQIAAACAPPAVQTGTPHALRIVSSQDTVPRTVYGPRDLLIVNGGTDAGIQLGSAFYVRRSSGTGAVYGMPADSDVITDGWIRIVAVNDSSSIARIERSCGAVFSGDYLEPFEAPPVVTVADSPFDPDFSSLARVVGGANGHTVVGINELMVIDRGSEDGVQPGARFAIYRDMTAGDPLLAAPSGTPLAAIGEAVVLNAAGKRSVVRVVRARDAILSGDYAAPAKQ